MGIEALFGGNDSMTKEEAIGWLNLIKESYGEGGDGIGSELDEKLNTIPDSGIDKPSTVIGGFTKRIVMALEMAIDTLGVSEE